MISPETHTAEQIHSVVATLTPEQARAIAGTVDTDRDAVTPEALSEQVRRLALGAAARRGAGVDTAEYAVVDGRDDEGNPQRYLTPLSHNFGDVVNATTRDLQGLPEPDEAFTQLSAQEKSHEVDRVLGVVTRYLQDIETRALMSAHGDDSDVDRRVVSFVEHEREKLADQPAALKAMEWMSVGAVSQQADMSRLYEQFIGATQDLTDQEQDHLRQLVQAMSAQRASRTDREALIDRLHNEIATQSDTLSESERDIVSAITTGFAAATTSLQFKRVAEDFTRQLRAKLMKA